MSKNNKGVGGATGNHIARAKRPFTVFRLLIFFLYFLYGFLTYHMWKDVFGMQTDDLKEVIMNSDGAPLLRMVLVQLFFSLPFFILVALSFLGVLKESENIYRVNMRASSKEKKPTEVISQEDSIARETGLTIFVRNQKKSGV